MTRTTMCAKTISLLALTLSGCASMQQDGSTRPSLFGSIFGERGQSVDALPINQKNAAQPAQSISTGNSLARNATRASLNNIPQDLAKVEGNIWRSGVNANQLFGLVARILSQNYIIGNADRKQLTLNTEWDKFFIEGRLFRNRISISVFPISPRQTELVMKNTVEYYAGNSGKMNENSPTDWLPTADLTDEVQRIIDSVGKQTAALQMRELQRR